MRRWIARQFQPDRRWLWVSQIVLWANLAFSVASSHIWPLPSEAWAEGERAVERLLDQMKHASDPAERDRLQKAFDAQTALNQAAFMSDIAEQQRVMEIRRRASNGATVVMFASMIPAFVAAHRMQRRRRWLEAGRCGQCGYDLRASPDRCPECGMEPVAAT